jgi:UPF0271 protein
MGEGIGNDEAIMPFITSANIACGYHAGDPTTMLDTILLAKGFNVAVGAHPSFLDRENFGRTEVKSSPQEVYELVITQIKMLGYLAEENNVPLHHVKPHGALYNMAAKDATLAKAIVEAVKLCDANLILYGLSGSHLIKEAKAVGLKNANEVFADRTYQNDGSLTPRSQPNALIEDETEAIHQVLCMIKGKKVITASRRYISIFADTVCIHGDGKHAVAFAQKIHNTLQQHGIALQPIQV